MQHYLEEKHIAPYKAVMIRELLMHSSQAPNTISLTLWKLLRGVEVIKYRVAGNLLHVSSAFMEDVAIRVDAFEGKDAHRERKNQVESTEVDEKIMHLRRALNQRPIGRIFVH